MLNLAELPIPIIAAPMAGGASTPALVAAVSGAEGLGFLAAGYRDAAQLGEAVRQTRELTGRPRRCRWSRSPSACPSAR